MHLLNITNQDYILMTILFGVLAIVAYSFRRKHATSAAFLQATSLKLPTWVIAGAASSLGLIEFITLSSYGAYGGFAAICLALIVFGVASYCFEWRFSQVRAQQANLFQAQASFEQKVWLICYSLLLIVAAGFALSITVTLFNSLLGWQFGNSALAIMAVIGVCLLIGGRGSAYYNQLIASLLSGIILAIVIVLAYRQLSESSGLLANLQQVALANGYSKNAFINPLASADLVWQISLAVLASGVIVLLNPYAWFVSSVNSTKNQIGGFGRKLAQLVLMLIMLGVGVLALASPARQVEIAGKRIVTEQTRLSDGSLGYVVRAIDSQQPQHARGLVPNLISNNDDEPTAVASPAFDFASAGLILIQQQLPYAFAPLFIIVLLLYKSISELLMFATTAVIRGIYAPQYNKSGEELENLWAARVFLFMFIVLTISAGLVFYKFFNVYYTASLLIGLAIPLIFKQLGAKSFWWLDLVVYAGLGLWFCSVALPGMPGLFSLITLASLQQLLSYSVAALVIIYGISHCLIQFFVKK